MPFGSLWIPVILSAVVVFVASSILHMVLKYHKADMKPLPNEGAVREALAKGNPAPGVYFTPYCAEMKQMNEPAAKEKFEKGPVAMLTIHPKGAPMMPKLLALWFSFSVLVSFVAAYVARHTLHPGDDGMLVMRITGTVAFAGYALSHLSDSIWKGEPWSNTVRAFVDGAIYALLTGLTFRLLWPAA
ncbi:MAG TPA: hypothetical protein VFT43_03275 [Candidatus Polarisedimenticolia bacterium]|nr:hypothetical protein [Candidatus Polarisedimenticolia bacterium]